MAARTMKLILAGLLVLLLLAPAAWAAPDWSIAGAQSRYAGLAGQRVHYQVLGQDGPALVLVHGWGCDTEFWHRMAPGLAKGNRLVLVDLLGHGKSDKPRLAYSQNVFADCIKAVLDQEGLKDAVLVGHSMGGTVSLHTSRLYPDLVRALVLVDGVLIFPPQDAEALGGYKEQLKGWLAPMLSEGEQRKKVEGFVEPMLGPALAPADGQMIIAKMTATPPYVGLSAMQEMFNPDQLDFWHFGPVPKPVLAIYARQPEINQEFKDKLRAMCPDLTLYLLDGVGHFYMLERPEQVNRLIDGFVAGLQ